MKATRIVNFKYRIKGYELALARNVLGLSQEELSAKTGIERQNISALECKEVDMIEEVTKKALERGGIIIECESTMIPIPLLEFAEQINRELDRIKKQ